MNERYERGANLLKSKRPDEYEKLTKKLGVKAPDAEKYILEFVYGDIWSREGLDLRAKAIATVSALASIGGAETQLKSHIMGALECGCKPEEIIEVMYHIIPYAGFARGLNGLRAALEAFEEHKITVNAS